MIIDISNRDNEFYILGKSVLEQIFPIYDNQYDSSILDEFENLNYEYTNILDESSANIGGQQKIKSASKNIYTIMKNDGINKSSKKKIHNIISDLFQNIADNISFKYSYDDEKYERSKIHKAIILVIWVFVINSLIINILSLISPKLIPVCTIIVAPLIEEASKIISIKGHFEAEYFAVFNSAEFGIYISPILKSKNKTLLKAGTRLRLSAIALHGINTIIHKIFDSDKIRSKMNIKNDKDAKDKATFISYIIGILIHGSWNYASTFSQNFVDTVSGTTRLVRTMKLKSKNKHTILNLFK